MNRSQALLGVFAHPDDESFGPGGTLARYAAQGAQVHVIIATDGDAGSVNENHQRQDGRTLAQERSEELARAAVELGVASIWNLPYRDSGMRGSPDNAHPRALMQQPIERLAAELVDYIRRLKPQVVITHDPLRRLRPSRSHPLLRGGDGRLLCGRTGNRDARAPGRPGTAAPPPAEALLHLL